MSTDVFSEMIEYPVEERHIEFKNDVKWEGETKIKLTKHVLAMANLRDGGWIIIGKEEQNDRTFVNVGMLEENYNSFDPDNVKAFVYSHADPPVRLIVHKKEHDGKRFVGIEVKGFDTVPVICKKTESDLLLEGKIYVRSKGKPESVLVQNYAEMKEIIDIAIDNGLSNLLGRLKFLGIHFEAVHATDKEKFDEEIADLK
jgi:predicted HTH transcriptional regulator